MTFATPNSTSRFTGLWFCSPWILGFVFLFLWPFAASLYWSFCRFDLVNSPEWVGGENYVRLASELGTGQGFGKAVTNTVLRVPRGAAVGGCRRSAGGSTVGQGSRTSGLSNAGIFAFRNSSRCRQHFVVVAARSAGRHGQLFDFMGGSGCTKLA